MVFIAIFASTEKVIEGELLAHSTPLSGPLRGLAGQELVVVPRLGHPMDAARLRDLDQGLGVEAEPFRADRLLDSER